MAAFDEFRRVGVVVFANSTTEYAKLPQGAKQVRGQAGNVVPLVMVTNPDATAGIRGITYAKIKSDTREAVRDLKKLLAEKGGAEAAAGGKSPDEAKADAEAEAAEAEQPKSETETLAGAQEWTNKDGQTITAAVTRFQDDEVEFLLDNGTTVLYPVWKLDEPSRERLDQLRPKPKDDDLPSIIGL